MKYFRLMTSLPQLPVEVVPPMTPLSEIVKLVLEDVTGSNLELVQALLWKIDAQNAENFLLKKEVFDVRGTISKEDFENSHNLPPFLDEIFRGNDSFSQPDQLVKMIWESYYSTLMELAEKHSCKFLNGYAEFEVGLSNAIAKKRAEDLNIEVESSLVLGGSEAMLYTPLVLKAAEVDDPQTREMILDKERLALYQELEGIDPFSIDALLAYLAGAVLLDSWRLEKEIDPEKLLEVFA